MIEPPSGPSTPDPLRGWRLLPSVLTFGVYIIWRDERNRRIAREAQARLLRGHPGHGQRRQPGRADPAN